MIAVTLVRGEWYARMADLTEPRIRALTGLEVRRVDVPDDADPYREKLRLAERIDGPFAYFDADCVLLRPWPLAEPARLSLTLGPQWTLDGQTTRLYSTGVMLVPSGCRELFAAALSIHDGGAVGCYDEGPLTAAIRATGHQVDVLDRRYNRASTTAPGDDTVVWHLLGHHDSPRTKFELVRRAVERAGSVLNTSPLEA